MRDISARELKGHNILAVERFQDSTRWMIEFSVQRPCSYCCPGDDIPTAEETSILPNLRKRKTLQSAKIATLPKIHIQFCGTISFVLFFDFSYLFCGGCYNPKP